MRACRARHGKDPRIVELILRESAACRAARPSVLITQHRLGFVSASSGIDQSNVDGGEEQVLLLPLDPDASARAIREALLAATGRAGRRGHQRLARADRSAWATCGVAIGVAGMPALVDLRGRTDLFGRALKMSMQAYADEVASAANLLSGEAGGRAPGGAGARVELPAAGWARVGTQPPARNGFVSLVG